MRRPTPSDRSFFTTWVEENDRIDPAPAVSTPNRRRRRGVAALSAAAAAVTGLLVLANTASADPSAADWYRLRMCESSNDYATNTGNGHYGAYQFDLATWRSVGGTGYPNRASKAEQDLRALLLWRERGWQPWQCASIVGLTGGGSGSSGGSGGGAAGGGTVAAHPGYWAFGDDSPTIARWQKQMGLRGAPLVGTGEFGPKTLAVVEELQRVNGLPVTGRIGGPTWNLAWHGRYGSSAPAYPGPWSYRFGDRNNTVARFQRQLDTRGADFDGTGQFGPKTRDAVLALQRQNGLPQTGVLDAQTWRDAWIGVYRP